MASPDIFHRSCVRNPSLPESSSTGDAFSVVSYNILAECHRQQSDYSYTEEKFLTQNHRHQLLLKELQYLNADVVCLQEVNPEYYNTTLQPALNRLGYSGYFIKRTQDYFDEGGATFIRNKRFEVVSWTGISLTDRMKEAIRKAGLDKCVESAVLKYTDRSDVIGVCRLRCKETSRILTLGNVHIVWGDLQCIDVQSLQIAVAVQEVVSQAGSDSCPHIICGDFNSEPTSVGYQLARDGYLSDSNIATLQAVENLKLETGSKALINHLWGAFQHTSSNLTSAYKTCQGEEPDVTSFTAIMFSCVDYMFYGSAGLGVKDVLRVVDKDAVEETTGLPAENFPSDHLSLKASFFFR